MLVFSAKISFRNLEIAQGRTYRNGRPANIDRQINIITCQPRQRSTRPSVPYAAVGLFRTDNGVVDTINVIDLNANDEWSSKVKLLLTLSRRNGHGDVGPNPLSVCRRRTRTLLPGRTKRRYRRERRYVVVEYR